jgi:hypothetical protein
MREFDGYAAGKRHVAFAIDKTLTCEMNRDERCRAGRLHIDARSAQIKLVGNARRQDIFVVARLLELKDSRRVDQFAIPKQMMDEVGVHSGSGEYCDRPLEALRRVSRVFKSFPGAL